MAKDKQAAEARPEDDIAVADPVETPDDEIVVEQDGASNGEGVEDWKAQLEAAQKAREDAERKAAEAERQAQARAAEIERYERESRESRSTVANANMQAIDNAIANADMERSQAIASYKAAMEGGDYEAAANAQAQMAAVAVKQQRLKEGKSAIERQIEMAKSAPDPVDQYVSTLDTKAQAWIRAHPETVRDPAKRADLERAHYGAVYNRLAPNSDEYFRFIEREMGYLPREEAAQRETQASAQERTPAAPAAPVGRSAAPGSQSRPNVIKLTAAQREIAAVCGMSDAEYAKQLMAIQSERGATTH